MLRWNRKGCSYVCSTLKLESPGSSKILLTFYRSPWCHASEDGILDVLLSVKSQLHGFESDIGVIFNLENLLCDC
jgi:hypothetical protein